MIKQELKDLMNKKGLSFSSVAKSIGIATSSLNQWMNGNYKGKVDKIESSVKAFIAKEDLRSLNTKIEFTPTTVSEDVFDVARICHIDSEIGVCYGQAGLGKTFAVKEYAKQNSDVILIEADLGYTTKILFSEIHRKVDLDGIGTIYQMSIDIVDKLKNSGRLIIIDEAEHLPYKALDLLRRIYDKANVGIMLVGLPRLIKNLRGQRGQYEQLYSRVGVAKKLSLLEIHDTKDILGTIMPASSTSRVYHELSYGNARILSKLIYRSIKVAQINECPVNETIVRETAKMLIV